MVDKYVVMEKEPDYMFIVNKERQDVLVDQLQAINDNYQSTHGSYKTSGQDSMDTFGLLKFRPENQFLDYKVFEHSGNKNKNLILVYFSDRIMNLKAEELEMVVHI